MPFIYSLVLLRYVLEFWQFCFIQFSLQQICKKYDSSFFPA